MKSGLAPIYGAISILSSCAPPRNVVWHYHPCTQGNHKPDCSHLRWLDGETSYKCYESRGVAPYRQEPQEEVPSSETTSSPNPSTMKTCVTRLSEQVLPTSLPDVLLFEIQPWELTSRSLSGKSLWINVYAKRHEGVLYPGIWLERPYWCLSTSRRTHGLVLMLLVCGSYPFHLWPLKLKCVEFEV